MSAADRREPQGRPAGGSGVGPVPAPPAVAGAALSVEVAATIAALAGLRADYDGLQIAAANQSPFALHEWHMSWCAHFLNLDPNVEDELAIHVLRDQAGRCVAIVPLVFSRRRFGPLRIVSINLLGADPSTTESRTPLVAPGYETRVADVVRARLRALPGWDWITWGGIEESFNDALTAGAELQVVAEAPGYLLDLAASWDQFRAGLKRNIRESLRHGYNSLRRDGHSFELDVATASADVRRGVARFLELHASRARMAGTVEHPDHFATDVSKRFLFDVCERLAARGIARVYQLRIGAEVVAVRIGFVVGNTLYLYYSGFDPRWARYGVMTTTVAEALKHAIGEGLTTVNLSRGTDTSKTRWSPREVPYVCAFERRSRLVSRLAHQFYVSARSGTGLQFWILRRLGKARRVWS